MKHKIKNIMKFSSLLVALLFFSDCASIGLGQLAIATQQLSVNNDILTARMDVPSINNRAFDAQLRKVVQDKYQKFRDEILSTQTFNLLEQSQRYLYTSSFQVYTNELLQLLSIRIDARWVELATTKSSVSFATAVFWLKDLKKVTINDLFIDPVDIYDKISRYGNKTLASDYPTGIIANVLKGDSNHIRLIAISNEGLNVFWPAASFQSQSEEPIELIVPWAILLEGRSLNMIIAKEFLN